MAIDTNDFRGMCDELYPFEDLEPLEELEQIESLLNPQMASAFTPLALLGSHGVIANWRDPKGGEAIVWLDSEGSNWVVAEDLDAFCAMLPYSTGSIYDFCSGWEYYDPDDEDSANPEERFTPDVLERYLSDAKEAYERHAELLAWLESKGIQIDPNPVATIGRAQKNHTVLADWVADQL
jgi:hypothetical protein